MSDSEDGAMREKLSNVSLSSGGEGVGGYSPVLGTSPRQPSKQGGANLLNLDGGATTSGSENEDQPAPAQPTKSSNFDILLDFGDSPSASNVSHQTATTPSAQNTSTKSDLENLLGDLSGGVSNTSTANSTANNSSSSANLMFDPFGAFDVPSAAKPATQTPPLIQPTSSTASMRSSASGAVPPLRTQNLQSGLLIIILFIFSDFLLAFSNGFDIIIFK